MFFLKTTFLCFGIQVPSISNHNGSLRSWVHKRIVQINRIVDNRIEYWFQIPTKQFEALTWSDLQPWYSFLWPRGRFIPNKHSFRLPWRRKWQPTPVLLPGKSHRLRSLVGYNPLGCKELDMTERLHFHFQIPYPIDGVQFSQKEG